MTRKQKEIEILERVLEKRYTDEEELARLCADGRRSWDEYEQLQAEIGMTVKRLEHLRGRTRSKPA